MRRIVTAVGLLVLLGCSSGPAPTSPAPTSPAPTSPAPTSVRVLVAGTTVCQFTSEITTDNPAPGVSVYTATMACTDEMSDPRVSGRDAFDLTETEALVGGQGADWFRCLNQVLTNEGGSWRGECFGSEFHIPGKDGLWTSGYSILHGEGAYEGLVYHQLYAQSPWDMGSEGYVVAGWIEPAEAE